VGRSGALGAGQRRAPGRAARPLHRGAACDRWQAAGGAGPRQAQATTATPALRARAAPAAVATAASSAATAPLRDGGGSPAGLLGLPFLDCPGGYQSWVHPTGAGMYPWRAGTKALPERARSPQGARAASAAAARAAQGRLAAEHQHVQEVNSFVAAPF
jgi:hypothetical protein